MKSEDIEELFFHIGMWRTLRTNGESCSWDDILLHKPVKRCTALSFSCLLFSTDDDFGSQLDVSAPSNCTTMEAQVPFMIKPISLWGNVLEKAVSLCHIIQIWSNSSIALIVSFYVLGALEQYDGSGEDSWVKLAMSKSVVDKGTYRT
jgi:hypothetical protein